MSVKEFGVGFRIMKKAIAVLIAGLLLSINAYAVEIIADNKTVNDYVNDGWVLHSIIQGDDSGNLIYTLTKEKIGESEVISCAVDIAGNRTVCFRP